VAPLSRTGPTTGLAGRIGIALVALSLVAIVAPARAENPLLADKPPVMRVRPLHSGRHIVAPQFGITIADEYQQNLMAGIYWRYHFNSWLGVGADIWAGGGVSTSLSDDIERELSREGRPFELSTNGLRLLANVAVELVPFSGKAILLSDALMRIDVHIDLGVGIAMVSGNDRIDDSISLAPTFGVGIRLFPNRWLSIGFDIKDYIVERALASRRDGSVPGAEFGHNWLFGLSIGFSFPTNPMIENER
jgi:outer membrane beta-barrel protein